MLQDTVPLKKKSSKQKFVAKNKSVRKHIETILVHEESTKFSRDVLKADCLYFVPDDQKQEAEPQEIPLSTLDVIDTQLDVVFFHIKSPSTPLANSPYNCNYLISKSCTSTI